MAGLLKGSSDAVVAENVRYLRRYEGLSESDATEQALAYARGEGESESDDDEGTSVAEEETDGDGSDGAGVAAGRQWVVITKDFSGLGWAKRLDEEGETVTVAYDPSVEDEPKHRKLMKQVGKGWLNVVTLADVRELESDTTYWLFAENNFSDLADALRKRGQKVFGTSKFTDHLEHDRQAAVDMAKEAGLRSPETHEFHTLDEGLAFLDDNAETAYVFKPDDGTFNYMTFVPCRMDDADANRETYFYLAHMPQDPGSFILQERLPKDDVVEVNVECWMQDGRPFLALLGLEVKRKNTGDIGEMCGCGGDFVQIIPVESPLVQKTIGKLFPYYEREAYTGLADVNILLTKNNTPYFLEVCNRFGYNAHVTMLLGLAKDRVADILADWMDGHVEGMAERFHTDVAGSMTLFCDHPREGLPVHVEEAFTPYFYTFDGWKEDGQLLLTGYSDEIGICVGRGATIPAAARAIWDQVVTDEAVSVPDMYYRTDLGATDYSNAPARRYTELQKRGLL